RHIGLDEMVKNIDEGELSDRDRCTADCLFRLLEGLGLRKLHEHEGPRRTAGHMYPEVAKVGSIRCERSQSQTFRQERELRPHGLSDEGAIRRSHYMLGRRRISCTHTERMIAGASQLVTE